MSEIQLPIGMSTQAWLNANGFQHITQSRVIGGNTRNQIYLLTNDRNHQLVAKISATVNDDAFSLEAYGLNLLDNTEAIRIPEVLHVSDKCLLIEYIASTQQANDYWTILADQLASLHRNCLTKKNKTNDNTNQAFGLEHNNYCGENLQSNQWSDDGHAFFSEERLLYQARLAFDNGYLESPWIIHIESICERLTELIPVQPASLIHGDLWSGNILVDDAGKPALIDPAVYYGWREADIAMTLMFGGLPHEFYVAYDEAWPLEANWRNRVPLYNLYHLLNHLNIFGTSYLEQVQATISRYA